MTTAASVRTSNPAARGLRAWLMVLLLCAAAGSVLAQPAAPQDALPAVMVEQVRVQPASNPLEFVARVEAIESVDIRARVQGFLQTVAFEAGQSVEVGDLLFTIEPDQYEAGVASARAQLSQSEASHLEAARALARVQALAKQQSVSRAALDEARADADIAAANVEAAKAALRNAELNLSYTRITAPIAGEIGRALFTRGNLVGPESGSLARIVQLDPIRVVFSISEQLLVTLRQRTGTSGEIDPETLRFTLRLPNDTQYPHRGRLEYIAQEASPQTGTIAVRAVFPNPDRLLLHNQYATIVVDEDTRRFRPVVPQAAVLQDREGRFVYVVDDQDRASQRRIETGARVRNGWAVTEGLRGGEIVVVQGTQRLTEGAKVRPIGSRPLPTDDPPEVAPGEAGQ